MHGQDGGTLTWSVAVHWVHRLWGFPGGTGQAPSCVLPRATLPELQSNLSWLLLVLVLEIPRQSQAMNLGWLLLVSGWGHLARVTESQGSLRLAVADLRGIMKL